MLRTQVLSPARPRSSGRARPLPVEARRQALVVATLPLLREHGTAVSTRQIAEAAGVAEGTIFRAFANKEALIQATVTAALDPAPALEELAEIDLSAPLRERLVHIVTVLQRRLADVFAVVTAAGMSRPPGTVDQRRKAATQTSARIAELLSPDAACLSRSPLQVADLLRMLTLSNMHAQLTDNTTLTPTELVSVLLDGVLRDCRELHSRAPEDETC